MRSNVEPSHARESFWEKYSNFKVNLGNLQLFIDELSGVCLLSYELLSRWFCTKYYAFCQIHWILFFLVQLCHLIFYKFLHLFFVLCLYLCPLEATCWGIECRAICLVGKSCKISIAQIHTRFNCIILSYSLLKVGILLNARELHAFIGYRSIGPKRHRHIWLWIYCTIIILITSHYWILLIHLCLILKFCDISSGHIGSCCKLFFVHEMINCCDLILTEVASAKITLHFFKVIDYISDVLLLEIFFWVLW